MSERDQIIESAREHDSDFDANALVLSHTGLGPYENVHPADRTLAIAIWTLTNHGLADDTWDTKAGTAERVGAFILETDEQGFHVLATFKDEDEAEEAGELLQRACLEAEDDFTRVGDLVKTEDIDVAELSGLSLESRSIDYDFSAENWAEVNETGDGYRFTEPHECQECHVIAFANGGDVECPNENCPKHGNAIADDCGPMMNYYYPLSRSLDDDEIANLVRLPLVYVEIDDEPGLALSGGGMDLSWEICEAFMRLGFLPPINFARLPAMCGRGGDARDRKIIEACRRTAHAAFEAGEQSRHSILSSLQDAERLAAERGDR